MSEDENKSSRLSYTCETSTKTNSEQDRSPNQFFRHVPGEFMPTHSPGTTPKAKPCKIIKKESHH